MRFVLTAVLAAATLVQPARIFVFEQPFYINLHHFLYVLGRNENRASDRERRAVVEAPKDQAAGLATLTTDEQATWRAAVTEYANTWSKKDTVFDSDLVSLTQSLVRANAAPNDVLRRVEPIYRKAWWPAHNKANSARIADIQQLLDQHGAAVLAYITRQFGEAWPSDGYPVNVSGYTNWAGAYSTDNRLLVISGLDGALTGLSGLETIFHEAMHQWDEPMFAKLKVAAMRAGKPSVPNNLSHALIFYTAGEAVRSIAPDYTPYADAQGVWLRGMTAHKAALDAHWKPYLEGKITFDAAVDAIIRQLQ